MVAKLDELGVSGDEDGAALRAEAAKEVGDELSRDIPYQVRTSRYTMSFLLSKKILTNSSLNMMHTKPKNPKPTLCLLK